MGLSQSEARRGLLVMLYQYDSPNYLSLDEMYGIIMTDASSTSSVEVKFLPAKDVPNVTIPRWNLTYVLAASDEILESYAAVFTSEMNIYKETQPLFAQNMHDTLEIVHSKLFRKCRILLATYMAKASQDPATAAETLSTMLHLVGDEWRHCSGEIQRANFFCWIELSKLFCLAPKFENALTVVRSVAHWGELAEDQKTECLDVLHKILLHAPDNDSDIPGKACDEILRLNARDEVALQFLAKRSGK